jgi:hypothetical protein
LVPVLDHGEKTGLLHAAKLNPFEHASTFKWAIAVIRPPNPKDVEASREHFGVLYIKFIQIFKKLSMAYDQMTHPQKRRVLRLLLEGTMGRLLELKHTLVGIECTHFNHFDDILADIKLSPDDIEIPIPPYFRRENLKALKERERILDDLDAKTLDPRLKAPEPVPPARDVACRAFSENAATWFRRAPSFMLCFHVHAVIPLSRCGTSILLGRLLSATFCNS